MACAAAGTAHYTVAVGAKGPFPGRQKSCRTPSAESAGRLRVEEGQFFTAVAAGDARAECGGESLVFEIREVKRLALTAERSSADYVQLTLDAFDAQGRELWLGDHPEIDWQVPGGLESRSGCHGDIIPACDPAYVIAVRPSRAGDHRVVVRFAGLEAAVDIDHP